MFDILKNVLKVIFAVILIAVALWVIRYIFEMLGVESNNLLGIGFFAILIGIFAYGFRVE